MKTPILLLLLVLLLVPKKAISQDLNDYKYVIVPDKYDLFEEADKYQLNSLTEFLFEKYGFTAIYAGEDLPMDYVNNPCSAVTANLQSDSGTFSFVTKVVVVLKNCRQEVVFKSKEGRSRLKKYKFAYQESLRDAFSSIKALNYSYSEPDAKTVVSAVEKNNLNPNKKGIKQQRIFEYNGNEYIVQQQGNGMVLKKRGTAEPFAFLNETSKGSFLFRSEELNGTAYFNERGSLEVEYFDIETDTMKKRVYERK